MTYIGEVIMLFHLVKMLVDYEFFYFYIETAIYKQNIILQTKGEFKLNFCCVYIKIKEENLMKLNRKKYLLSEDEIRIFYSKKDLQEYLDFRKENDEWISCYINELAAVGIPNLPLFIPAKCTDINVKRSTYTIEVENIDYEQEDNDNCINNTGLFLIIPYQNKMVPFPTRGLAYNTICQRVDDYCGTMLRFDEKPTKSVLPIDEKAARLTRDFELYSDRCKILYRDAMVSAVLSKEYVILPADKLLEHLEEKLQKAYPDLEFIGGEVSIEHLICQYNLNDRAIEEKLRIKLNNMGNNINTLKAGIQFSTSDIGLSSVTVNIFFDCDGIRMFLAGINIPHKGDTSIEKFANRMEEFDMILKESEERIEILGNMEINNVASVVEQIAQEYNSVFPQKTTFEVVNELKLKFPSGGTGIDVYLGLNDIINRHNILNILTLSRYLSLLEDVAKLIKLPFDKIDTGEFNFRNFRK